MALGVPKSKFLDHFPIQIPPLKPLFRHCGNHFGPRKSDYWPFIDFGHFPIEIPIETEKFYGKWKEVSYSKNKNCFGISEQNGTTCRYVQS